jgi:methylase of polypeptide subunit release factors
VSEPTVAGPQGLRCSELRAHPSILDAGCSCGLHALCICCALRR